MKSLEDIIWVKGPTKTQTLKGEQFVYEVGIGSHMSFLTTNPSRDWDYFRGCFEEAIKEYTANPSRVGWKKGSEVTGKQILDELEALMAA